MNNVLMIKGDMIHFVKTELVEEFEARGWSRVDLKEKNQETETKETTRKRAKKQ